MLVVAKILLQSYPPVKQMSSSWQNKKVQRRGQQSGRNEASIIYE